MDETFYTSPHTGREYTIHPKVTWYTSYNKDGSTYKTFVTQYHFVNRATGEKVPRWVTSLEPRVLEAFFGEEEGVYKRWVASRFD